MESTKLQTRALSGVALARNAVNRDNADALFTFSAFLGHHVLFDTFSAREHLSGYPGQAFPMLRTELEHPLHRGRGHAYGLQHDRRD